MNWFLVTTLFTRFSISIFDGHKSFRFISLPFALRIEPASILKPPILPPVNNTCEPVIWPVSFNFNMSPTDTVPSATANPPTDPPIRDNAEALTIP